MLKKTCPFCNNSSFSSTTRGGPWICPSCGEDISHVPTEPPIKKLEGSDQEQGRAKKKHSIIDLLLSFFRLNK